MVANVPGMPHDYTGKGLDRRFLLPVHKTWSTLKQWSHTRNADSQAHLRLTESETQGGPISLSFNQPLVMLMTPENGYAHEAGSRTLLFL